MSNIVEEYAYQITVKGSKVAIQAFDKVANASKKLGEVDKQNLSATEKQTKAITKQSSALWLLAKRLLGVYSVYALFKKGLNLGLNFAEQGNMIANLATTANISTKSLQKWGYALKRYGGSEQSIAGTMASLQQRLFEYQQWGNANAFAEFMKLGGQVPAGSTPEQFLKSLSKQLQRLPRERALAMANSLGIDSATTRFLLEGNVEKDLANAKVLYTDADIKMAQQAKQNLIEFNREMEKLGVLLGRKVLPYITDFLKIVPNIVDRVGQVLGEILNGTFLKKYLGKPGDIIYKAMYKVGAGYYGMEEKNDQDYRQAVLGRSMRRLGGYQYTDPLSIMPALSSLTPLASASNAWNNLNQSNNIVINGTSSPETVGKSVVEKISDFSFNGWIGFMSEVKS
jgi:hypothetical protein